MNNTILWILVLILTLILLGLIVCPSSPGTGQTGHIVTTGNGKFTGDQEATVLTSGDGYTITGGSTCIDLAHFQQLAHLNHSLDITSTFLLEFECPTGPGNGGTIRGKFFIQGVDQSQYFYQKSIISHPAGGSQAPQSDYDNISISPTSIQYNTSTSKCTTKITAEIVIDKDAISDFLQPGYKLNVVFQIKDDAFDTFHDHSIQYPDCVVAIAGNGGSGEESRSNEAAGQVANARNGSNGQPGFTANGRLLNVTSCAGSIPDNLLDHYTCDDISSCHPRDHVVIFNLPSICP